MRIEKFHLERFGHFDDLHLDFSGDNVRLHVIYGPNEAGKSTALAAICDVLFGIPERTPYNFLHDYSRLRIGATITNAAGQHLAFKRRKARGNSLLKPDESGELPADSLGPFMGGATEDFFTRMFGLNHQRLREGGKGMLEAGGDIARSLFEAGAGTAHLSTVMRQLSDDADAIGAPIRKASSKPYWQAHDLYEKAISRMKSEMLRADHWVAAERAVTAARTALKEAEDALAESRREQSALERIRRVAPILRRIEDLQERLDALGDGVDLPEGFAETWQQATKAFEDTFAAVKRTTEALDHLRGDLKALGSADPWPASADRITALMTHLGDYIDKCRSIPNRERELALGWGQVEELLKKLGLSMSPEEIADRAPTARSVGRVKALIAESNRLDVKMTSARDELEQVEAAVRQAERQLEEAGSPVDPAAAAAAVKSASELGNTAARHAQAKRALEKTEEDLADVLSGLGRWSLGADELAKRAFPAGEAVARLGQALDRLGRDQEALADERERKLSEQRDLGGELIALEAGGEVPTPEALQTAREHRDDGWRLIRRRYVEGADLPEQALAEFGGDAGVAEAFEGAVHHADYLADGREREADRIARFATSTGQLEKVKADLAALETRQEDLEQRKHTWTTEWEALWQQSGVKPGAPADMRDWLARKDQVLSKLRDFRSARSAEQEAAAEDHQVRDHLIRAAAKLGLDGTEELTTPVLRERVTVALDAADKRWTGAVELKRTLTASRQQVEERREDLAQVEADQNQWRKQWAAEVPALGLPSDAAPEEADEALSVWQEIEKLRADLLQTAKRLRDMQEVIAAYEADVGSLMSELGEAAADLSKETDCAVLVPLLRNRLDEAQQRQARIDEVQARIRKAEADHEVAEEQLAAANQELASLRQTHGLQADADVPALARASDERRVIVHGLQKERDDLSSAGDGLDEDALREAVSRLGADDVVAGISRIGDEITRQLQDVQGAERTLTEAQGELRALGQREGAGSAAQEANDAAAEMVDHVERWLRLRAANIILNRAVERYREANQHPLVQRASEIFAAVASTGANPIT
ncbi:MAG: AAA family ATPase, partial [Nisaea sp.]|uniref:YhaN family protein n=1 Tax=Nisaea sp. TaxID=2024842 RepID=UPI001AFDEF0E